ncbi:MAG: 30S ribosomal protein S5 [Chthoniobacterales bacterium]|nr:30S ribosomal protein S5 [Chthoniobacterales bacterium]
MSNPIERIAARNNRTTSRERNRENPQVPNQVVTTESPQFHDKVVYINRCAKVVKGGRRFSFSALIVSGDQKGRVGIGFGKANEVSDAIRKATDAAHKRMVEIKIANNTIPHEVIGNFGGGCVLLKPASPGTGVIAGGGVRAVVEAAGIRDVLAKSLGSKNPANVVKATLDALLKLRHRNEIFQIRGKKIRSKSPNESSNPATNKQSEET